MIAPPLTQLPPCSRLFNLIFLIIICISLQSCGDTAHKGTGRYAIITFTGEDFEKEYVLTTDSLSTGFLKVPKGAEQVYSLIFSCHDGHYYGIDDGKPVFTKYKVTPKGLEPEAQIPFHQQPWKTFQSWHNWIDETTLLIGTTLNGKKFSYNVIDTQNMVLKTQGDLDVPPFSEGMYGGIMGQFRDNQLFIAYTQYFGWKDPTPPSDTTYLAVIDYPSFKTRTIFKDTRSTWPGGIYIHAPTSFTDEKGDIYLITAPGGRTHRHPTATSGIYRINKGEETLDPDYFFPVTEPGAQEAYLLYYIGNGKALVRTVDKSLISQYEDYLYQPVAGYSLVDLITGHVKKLDLPLGMLDFTETVLAENGEVHIAIAENNEASFIWKLNPDTGQATKGLKVEGRVMVLNRLH